MKTVVHRAGSRGHANYGWLDTYHTFSFAEYYNPERMSFGALRVLNDDVIEGGTGFGMHPHKNMEIISIPLSGNLEHRDSTGNIEVIREDDVQVMSAGSGITHSEYNYNKDSNTNFLQIWVMPHTQNVKPEYAQMHFPENERHNRLTQLVSPVNSDEPGLKIHQNARFFRGSFETGENFGYDLSGRSNGLYLFVIDGKVKVGSETLNRRDGIAISDAALISIEPLGKSDVLLMELPMN